MEVAPIGLTAIWYENAASEIGGNEEKYTVLGTHI